MGLLDIPFLFRRRRSDKLKIEVLEPSRRYFTREQILLLPLTGMVAAGSTDSVSGRTGMLMTLKDRLKAARKNPNVKAVILKIDSPGGEVTASDLIHRELLDFKRERGVPVIAWLGSMAASGGLYIAMAADEIYAQPTTVTGSIGVIAMLPGLTGLGEKLGIEMRVIKSGENKDLGSPWRTMTAEQRRIFDDLIDGMNVRFREVVLQSRQPKALDLRRFEELADGRILDAMTAWAIHLTDGIKYPAEIIARAREVARLDDYKLVSYEYANRRRGNIYAQTGPPAWGAGGWASLAQAAARGLGGGLPENGLGEAVRPVFFYLWQP